MADEQDLLHTRPLLSFWVSIPYRTTDSNQRFPDTII